MLAEQQRLGDEARSGGGGAGCDELTQLPSLSMAPPPVPALPTSAAADNEAGTRNLAQVWHQIYRDSTVNGSGLFDDFLVSLGSQQIIEGRGGDEAAAAAPAAGNARRVRPKKLKPPTKLDVAPVPPSPVDVRAAQRAARERRANKRKAGGTPRGGGSVSTPGAGAGCAEGMGSASAPVGEPAAKGRKVKNRESAARSRARRQAYTTELEHQVEDLIRENRKLRRRVVEEGQAEPDNHNKCGLRRSRTLS